MSFKIEKALDSDFDEIVDIWEASVRATHGFLLEEDILLFRGLIEKSKFKGVSVFCIKEDGKILGFLGTEGDNVEMLFLDPTQMGKGLGRIFLTYAIEELGISKIDVNEQNPKALAFYEHLGFKVIGRTEVDPNGKPYPTLHMELFNREG